MITSEVVPFAKAGGLGDMVAALSAELERQGHDVRVILPRYYSIDIGRMQRINGPLGVPLGERDEWCALYQSRLPDAEVPVYFLDHEVLYGRDGIYGTRGEPGFADNLQRFALLSRGAFQLCRALDWFPDVMHSPRLALGDGSGLPQRPRARGGVRRHRFDADDPQPGAPGGLPEGGLQAPSGFAGPLHERRVRIAGWPQPPAGRHPQRRRPDHGFAHLRSKKSRPRSIGCGLDALLREREADLFGVLNGMDYEVWNPETDLHIPANYSHEDLGGKAVNKAALQEAMGLEVDPKVPVVAMISRLVDQKGFGQLCGPTHGSLWSICDELDLQFVILGTGDAWCEEELANPRRKTPQPGGGPRVQRSARSFDRGRRRFLPHAERLRTVRTEPDVLPAVRNAAHRSPNRRPRRYG